MMLAKERSTNTKRFVRALAARECHPRYRTYSNCTRLTHVGLDSFAFQRINGQNNNGQPLPVSSGANGSETR